MFGACALALVSAQPWSIDLGLARRAQFAADPNQSDGSLHAPTGSANFPTSLNGYVKRPPWKVAGVDYRVGAQTGVSITPAADVEIPSVQVRKDILRLKILDHNTTLENIDFNDHWWLEIAGKNAVIRNCQFIRSAGAEDLVFADEACGGFTMDYCYFDAGPRGETKIACIRYTRLACLIQSTRFDIAPFQTRAKIAGRFRAGRTTWPMATRTILDIVFSTTMLGARPSGWDGRCRNNHS